MFGEPCFIVFEGIDGSGKTTQAGLLVSRLKDRGINAMFTYEPTRGYYGQQIRSAQSRLSPADEELLFREDRREHVRGVIQPSLEAGVSVICDRYIYSSAAYQGARGLDYEEIISLNLEFAPFPDLVFILETQVATSMERIRGGRDAFSTFEVESDLQKVEKIYALLKHPDIVRINASASVDAVHNEIWNSLMNRELFHF